MVREKRAHFIRRFEIEFRRVTHPPFVVHHLSRADADHDVVRVVMTPFQEMHVVRGDQTEAEFLRQRRQDGVALLLRFNPVIVQLEEEIFRTENIAEIGRALARLRHVVGLDRHVDLAFEAGAHSD